MRLQGVPCAGGPPLPAAVPCRLPHFNTAELWPHAAGHSLQSRAARHPRQQHQVRFPAGQLLWLPMPCPQAPAGCVHMLQPALHHPAGCCRAQCRLIAGCGACSDVYLPPASAVATNADGSTSYSYTSVPATGCWRSLPCMRPGPELFAYLQRTPNTGLPRGHAWRCAPPCAQ